MPFADNGQAEVEQQQALLASGTIHVVADMLKAITTERPENPILYLSARLHRQRGLSLTPGELNEFLTNCTTLPASLLVETLKLSFGRLDGPRYGATKDGKQLTRMAADALIATFKTESALPASTDGASASTRDLFALSLCMARSKMLLNGLPKQPVVAVAVELQSTAERDDRVLLRSAEEHPAGRSFLQSLTSDLEWLGASSVPGKPPNLQWELHLVDVDSSGSPSASCAQVAESAKQHLPSAMKERVHIVTAPSVLAALADRGKQNPDSVVLMQQPSPHDHITQFGLAVRQMGAKDAPPLALVAEETTAAIIDAMGQGKEGVREGGTPSGVLLSCYLQALLGIQTHHPCAFQLRPSVVGLKYSLYAECKAGWNSYAKMLLSECSTASAAPPTNGNPTTEEGKGGDVVIDYPLPKRLFPRAIFFFAMSRKVLRDAEAAKSVHGGGGLGASGKGIPTPLQLKPVVCTVRGTYGWPRASGTGAPREGFVEAVHTACRLAAQHDLLPEHVSETETETGQSQLTTTTPCTSDEWLMCLSDLDVDVWHYLVNECSATAHAILTGVARPQELTAIAAQLRPTDITDAPPARKKREMQEKKLAQAQKEASDAAAAAAAASRSEKTRVRTEK